MIHGLLGSKSQRLDFVHIDYSDEDALRVESVVMLASLSGLATKVLTNISRMLMTAKQQIYKVMLSRWNESIHISV